MTSIVDQADHLSRRRARAATALAITFMATQGGSIASRNPSLLDITLLIWVAMLVIILMFGGGWFSGVGVRRAMNDETTRAHRRCALATGFVVALAGAVALYVLSFFEDVATREALRLMITMSVSAALLRFGKLEKRALAGGE